MSKAKVMKGKALLNKWKKILASGIATKLLSRSMHEAAAEHDQLLKMKKLEASAKAIL
jgi:hypothetical protein